MILQTFKFFIRLIFFTILLSPFTIDVHAKNIAQQGVTKIIYEKGVLTYYRGGAKTIIEQKWEDDNIAILSPDGLKLLYTKERDYHWNKMVKYFENGNVKSSVIDPNDPGDNPDNGLMVEAIKPSPKWEYVTIVKRSESAGFLDVLIFNLKNTETKPFDIEEELRNGIIRGNIPTKNKESLWGLINDDIDNMRWISDTAFSFETDLLGYGVGSEKWKVDIKERKLIPIGTDNPINTSPFPDLKPDDPDYAIILKKYQDGTIKGDANGNLKLDKVMTRKDMLESSYIMNIPAIPADAVWPCSDMDIKDPLAPLFFIAFQRGLQPVDGNKCKLDEPMKRLEVVTIFFNGFKLNPAKIDCQGRWPDYEDPMLPNAPYAALAKSNRLFGEAAIKLEPNRTMTKRELIKLEQKIVEDGIHGYGASLAIPCDIDKYAKEYTWNPESPVTKLLFRRKLMKWGAIGLGGALGLGGIVYGVMRRIGKGKK